MANKVAKNTTYLSLSAVLQKVLAFGFYIFLANQLGAELLGRYGFALSYTGIFVILMNFGFVPVLTREGAKDDASIQSRFEQILGIKVLLAIVSLVLLFGIFHGLNFFNPKPLYTVQLVYLAGAVVLLDTFRSVFLAVLRAKQKMAYEAAGQILYQLVVVIGGVAILMSGFQARAMVMIIGLASLVYFVYSVAVLIKTTNIRPRFVFSKREMIPIIKMAAPFALADVFFKLNGSIDTVMLEYLAGDRFVAWYNIASKLTVTLTIIPGSFATAFFPAMSKAFVESKERLASIFDQSVEYLMLVATPMSIGAFVMAPTIIKVAFPDFPAATSALRIFMASLLFLFINYPVGNLLNAANKQTTNTINMGIALSVNIMMNIILIPSYTYNGAAVAAVISSIVLVFLGLPHVRGIIELHVGQLLRRFIKTAVASGVMAIVVMWCVGLEYASRYLELLVPLMAGIVVYAIVLFIIRGVTVQELRELKQAMRNR